MLRETLSSPDGAATSPPDFDFATFQRRADSDRLRIVLRRLVVTNAVSPYPTAAAATSLTPVMRMTGIAERDKRGGTGVLARWRTPEETRLALEKVAVTPDLTLNSAAPLGRTAESATACCDRGSPSSLGTHRDHPVRRREPA